MTSRARPVPLFLVVLGLSCVLTLLAPDWMARAAAAWPLAEASHPYFQPGHAALLYLAAPLGLLAAFALFLGPSLAVMWLWGRPANLAQWTLMALAISIGATWGLSSLAKLLTGAPLDPAVFRGLWLAYAAGTSALLWARRSALESPISRAEGRRLLQAAVFVFLAMAAFAPKLFWEDFNSDGVDSLNFARSLFDHHLPYWHVNPGVSGLFHNYVLYTFPNHWFVVFLGDLEPAPRAPLFLYVALVFFAVSALAETGHPRRLGPKEEAVLWLALLVYLVVQGWNTSGEPHYADLSEHGAVDTLWTLSYLGVLLALFQGRAAWVVVFSVMTHTASAGGVALLGGTLGVFVLLRVLPFDDEDARPMVRPMAAGFGAAVLITLLYRFVYSPLLLAGQGNEFSPRGLLSRLADPHLFVLSRWNLLLFPSGLLPALSLLFVRGKDLLNLVVALVTLGFFALIYVQSWAMSHQFTPCMLLPLVVFWRLYLGRLSTDRARGRVLAAAAVGAAVSLVLSLPASFDLATESRRVGLATRFDLGVERPTHGQIWRATQTLYDLFPDDYRLEYPEQPWGTDPYVWYHYATRPKPQDVEINYVIQPEGAPAPPGFERIAVEDGFVSFVRDRAQWARHRNPDFERVTISPLYEPVLRHVFQFFHGIAEAARAAEAPPPKPPPEPPTSTP